MLGTAAALLATAGCADKEVPEFKHPEAVDCNDMEKQCGPAKFDDKTNVESIVGRILTGQNQFLNFKLDSDKYDSKNHSVLAQYAIVRTDTGEDLIFVCVGSCVAKHGQVTVEYVPVEKLKVSDLLNKYVHVDAVPVGQDKEMTDVRGVLVTSEPVKKEYDL